MFKLPEEVKRDFKTEEDISIDQYGNERTKLIRVCYFVTQETFNCKYFKEKK